MPRIRTIKPEFPQSESMGKISRDARLLFIELWTLADDSGRLRAASRMLASLLFPYDDDAPGLIDTWISELEKAECIIRYLHDGQTYIEITNWLQHQKIDRPSESRFPSFEESSRILANPRESSSLDQGPRTKDQGKDIDQGDGAKDREPSQKRKRVIFVKPTLEEVSEYCKQRRNGINAEHFITYYDSNDWIMTNGRKVRNWKQCIVTWENNNNSNKAKNSKIGLSGTDDKDYSIPEEYKKGGTW